MDYSFIETKSSLWLSFAVSLMIPVCVYGLPAQDKAVVPNGKKAETHIGRVAVRSSGNFNIKTPSGTVQGISYRYCQMLHRTDGYTYEMETAF